jgi:hypothetical protein
VSTTEGEGVTLGAIRSISPLRKKYGIWVFQGGNSIPAALTDKITREFREQRDRNNRSPRGILRYVQSHHPLPITAVDDRGFPPAG